MRSSIVLCLFASPWLAQDAEEESPLEGHSLHGEAFNEGPRQAAYLIPGSTAVHFPATTRSEEVQAFIDQGVSQLHGFWYFEAERSFRHAAALDEDCAIAYWGAAMSNLENEDRAADFAREAWLRRELVTPREQLYIDMLAKFYDVDYAEPEEGEDEHERKPKKDEDRWGDLIHDYETILWEYGWDIEAKALLANTLWMAQRNGHRTPARWANQAILDQVFAVEPEHPSHHYRIHLWDSRQTAEYVVDSAQRSGPSLPGIAHMWHMGGHIFAQLGRHDDAAWQQEASARVDHAHMMRDLVLPDQIHNYAHNNEWLIRSMRHTGRAHEAIALAKNMVELPRHPAWNMLDKYGTSSSYGRRRLFETLEIYEQWEQLIDLCYTMYLEPSEEADDEARRAFLLGKAFTFLRNDVGRDEQLGLLEGWLDEARTARIEDMEAAEEEALAEGESPKKVREAMAAVLEEHERALKDLRDKIHTLRALDSVLAGTEVEANLETLSDLRFDRMTLARLHAEAGDAERAEELASNAVERGRGGEAVPLATLAYVRHTIGDEEGALEAFRELREFSWRFDLDVPLFARLAPLAEAEGLDEDWRLEYRLPADITARVEHDTLGPRHWSPPLAPDWSAPDMHDAEYALADIEGPQILILFLGMGCVHCVEQLQAFKPAYDDFLDAGIPIVAIGTDSVDELYESQEFDEAEDAYPFPLLSSGADHQVFHDYRAWDDFEDMPLHGTFLIDADKRIRWQDISYEPFTDHEFLLAEAQRLLGLPNQGGGGAVAEASSSAVERSEPQPEPEPSSEAGTSAAGAE